MLSSIGTTEKTLGPTRTNYADYWRNNLMEFDEIPALILNKRTEIHKCELQLVNIERTVDAAERTYQGLIAADKELTNDVKRKAALAGYLAEDAPYQDALGEADTIRLTLKTLDADLEFLRRMFRVLELRLRAQAVEAELVAG